MFIEEEIIFGLKKDFSDHREEDFLEKETEDILICCTNNNARDSFHFVTSRDEGLFHSVIYKNSDTLFYFLIFLGKKY